MEIKIRSSVRGQSPSRQSETTILLGGEMVYLPDKKSPVIIQELTLDQIEAIPKDKYEVIYWTPSTKLLISPVAYNPSWVRRAVKTVRKRLAHNPIFGKVRKKETLHNTSNPRVDGAMKYTTYIRLITDARQIVEDIYYTNRELARNQKDAPPSDSGIFLPPIDEGKLSDCIMKIILSFFGDSDKGKICGTDYKLAEFCLLMHFYFRLIKILKKEARKPFCDYLENKVFMDESKFTPKTFNNYAKEKKYMVIEKGLNNEELKNIDFAIRPKPAGTLQTAFHEIGWNFHYSPYFEELRELRKNLEQFKI